MPRILISGASGLIGSALIPSLESHGYEVVRLVRKGPGKSNEIQWDPMHPIPPETVSGYEAVIHLSGESITGRWTAAKKTRIRDSRVVSTRNLSEALSKCQNPPKTFLCASATGYYGNRGDEVLTEESAPGVGFLPKACIEWEAATAPAANAGIRTVNLRTGIVLSCDGGALKQMLLPFRLGLGGRIGSGHQWWSWIHIDDFVAAVHHILENSPAEVVGRRASPPGHSRGLSGPINMVSPNPVTNAEFTSILAKVLRRPAILPVPAFAARIALGQLADEALLASARVEPKAVLNSGFSFRFPQLESALRDLL
jgi:uncharacterized protein (TIGR01777 family)